MIMVFDPQILFNDGFYDLDRRAHPGRLAAQAAVSRRRSRAARTRSAASSTSSAACSARAHPEFLCAAGFSSARTSCIRATTSDGEWYQLFQIGFGGIPGRPVRRRARRALAVARRSPTCRTNSSRLFPAAHRALRDDRRHGRRGRLPRRQRHRIVYRFLEPGEISIHDDRWLTYPWGVNGGLPGGRSRKLMVRRRYQGGAAVEERSRQGQAGDLLHSITWGGGGWGDPLTRDPPLVAKEVGRGLVTHAGAKKYGVVSPTRVRSSMRRPTNCAQHARSAADGDLQFRGHDRRVAQGLQRRRGCRRLSSRDSSSRLRRSR